MRDYGKIHATFWTGQTGRRLRGDPNAQVLALYLSTCPAANMTGVFVLSLPTMAHETGLAVAEVVAALERLHMEDFAHFDEECDLVWVVSMVRWQVGEHLEASDKRVPALAKQLAPFRGHPFVRAFLSRYEGAYSLPGILKMPLRSPSEGPSAALNLRKPPVEPRVEAPSSNGKHRDEAPSKPVAVAVTRAVTESKQPEGARAYAPDPSATEPEDGLAPGLVLVGTRPGGKGSRGKTRNEVAEVVAYYQGYHPRSFPGGLLMDTDEAKKIRKRLAEGYAVEDLKQAIDGFESDPWHQGANDRSKPFQTLELYMRDSKHVQQGIELQQKGPGLSGLNEREKQGIVASQLWMKGSGGDHEGEGQARISRRDEPNGGSLEDPGDWPVA